MINEAVADILGNKLGDQDFINILTIEKPSTARRIYNWIVDKLNKINKLTGYSNEKIFWADVKNKFENAYRQDYQGNNTNTRYSTEILKDETAYVKTENNKFVKADGTKMTPREVYQSLVGTTIQFSNGDSVKIVNRLPNKDMYNELLKRYPSKYNNVENIKEVNNSVNKNIEELLRNSTMKEPNVPAYKGRHQKQGITGFDTRTVKFYDGKNAYDIDFSIAILKDGSKIAYAQKYIEGNNNLTQKIKTVEARSEKSSLNQQSLFNKSIASQNKDVNTTTKYSMQDTTKYSMQEYENNSGSFSMQDKRFHVTGNENLNNASTLFFRTRENEFGYLPDNKYSQNNQTWQSYLDENYKNTGKGQTIQDVKLPTKESYILIY